MESKKSRAGLIFQILAIIFVLALVLYLFIVIPWFTQVHNDALVAVTRNTYGDSPQSFLTNDMGAVVVDELIPLVIIILVLTSAILSSWLKKGRSSKVVLYIALGITLPILLFAAMIMMI